MTRRPQLPVGLYDLVMNRELREAVASLDKRGLLEVRESLDPQEAPEFLARAVGQVLARVLRSLPQQGRLEAQVGLCNQVIEMLAEARDDNEQESEDLLLGERLLAVLRKPEELVESAPPRSPGIPLGQSSLLVNAPRDYRIGTEVVAEIESADSIDLLCSFIKNSGFRLVRQALRDHCAKGRPLRVLTTTYLGVTEVGPLNDLHHMGAQVRVSYDARRTRLHAKAWYFQRNSGFDTAFVGSSNLSAPAMLDGLEWNVRISATELPKVASKFRATFDNYWNDGEFESYVPERDEERLRAALNTTTRQDEMSISFFDITPYPFQQDILDKLWAERRVHDRWHNLVVAATGTGKTIMAALDYKRALDELGHDLTLLFVAHRKEILQQSLSTFRQVLRSRDFGELLVDGQRPERGEHLFASVQSLSRTTLDGISPDRFDFIIVDEVHHASAPTYERLLKHFKPGLLLGLTATPERADGGNIKEWFDDRFAAELRIWDAIDRGLLAPFQYFVLNDETDLSNVTWGRGRYATSELENLYTGDDARVRMILTAVKDHVSDIGKMRALGFCVGVEHARFMARRFNEAGIAAAALTGETDRESRSLFRKQLREGHLQVLFTVDIFNEGVDLPEVDTVLFLRPTESAMLFLQQLGRGLRLHDGKDCLTALDFVGNVNRKFRFDLRFRALTGASRKELAHQVEQGFPFLPSGCSIQLDRVAQNTVLENLRQTLSTRQSELVRELLAYGSDVDLARFLDESQLELTDIYRGKRTWSDLKRAAGFPVPAVGEDEARALQALVRVLHWDDTVLLDAAGALAQGDVEEWAGRSTGNERCLRMVLTSLYGPEAFVQARQTVANAHTHLVLRAELGELLPILKDRITHQALENGSLKLKGIPLRIHCTYSRDEIVAAHRIFKSGRLHLPREGVYFDTESGHNLLFVTLLKTEKDYSPSTMYEDYAISPSRFHWQSQSNTRPTTAKGRRHVEHDAMGVTPLLFVRERKKDDRGVTKPYLFLGPLEYESHKGARPMNIIWKLKYPMPMDAFRASKVVGG